MSTVTQSTATTARMYASGKYSDLIITCQGRSFKVHRAVVCLQSKPIAAMVDGQFKESITGVIDLPENEVDVVEKMLEFLYLGVYSDGSQPNVKAAQANAPTQEITSRRLPWRAHDADAICPPPSDSPESAASLLFNARVYTTAEQYDIPALKELAVTKYTERLPSGWNSASFVASLKVLYELTPESDRLLKDIAIKIAGENAQNLLDREEFVALCKENGEIAFDVLKASLVLKAMPPLRFEACPGCGTEQYAVQDPGTKLYDHDCIVCGRDWNSDSD